MQEQPMPRDPSFHLRLPPTLDIAGHFPFRLLSGPEGQPVLELDLQHATRRYFAYHLHEQLTLECDGQVVHPAGSAETTWHKKRLQFVLPKLEIGTTLDLSMNGQPVATMEAGDYGLLKEKPLHQQYQLAPSEVRAYGRNLRRDPNPARDLRTNLPYDRAARQTFNPHVHAPCTDVHTHYSAQISGKDLLEVALEKDLTGEATGYPVELLTLLDVWPAKDEHQRVLPQTTIHVPSREFNPMRDEGLQCEQRDQQCEAVRIKDLTDRQKRAIIRKMDIAPDGTMSFSDFDREMYRYRNPFVKHPALAKAIIKKIAEDYAAKGVTYAELSTGSMMDPAWFKQMVAAIAEIERDGVGPDHAKPHLRFIVGLPRNASPQRTIEDIEKVKYLARHPYILGIDLLGYESTKTSDFHWALSHIAQWAKQSENTDLDVKDGWDFQRDFIIRLHAGETGKNPTNVTEAIHLAHDHGVRVRVGHALNYILDEETKRKLNTLNQWDSDNGPSCPDMFASERAMDSNQVYRTKVFVHHQTPPIPGSPCFLGSDGGGALGVGPIAAAYSALASGWDLQQLADMRQYEEGYIARQMARESEKFRGFNTRYQGEDGLDNFLTGYRHLCDSIKQGGLPDRFFDKKAIFIGGASGTSWRDMDAKDREENIRIAELIIKVFDPEKIYFVLGRVQNEGISKAFDVAIMRHNESHPEKKFMVLGRYAGAGKAPSGELAHSISWLQDIPQGRDYVPASMLNYIREERGKAIFFNGSDYTAEMAYGAPDHNIPYALHEPRRGKMKEVVESAETDSVFHTLEDFVSNVLEQTGEQHFFRTRQDRDAVLRKDIDLKQLVDEVRELELKGKYTSNIHARAR